MCQLDHDGIGLSPELFSEHCRLSDMKIHLKITICPDGLKGYPLPHSPSSHTLRISHKYHNQLTLCEHIKLHCTKTTDLGGNKRLSKIWLVAKYKLGNQMRVLISVSNAQVKPVFLKIQLHRPGFWNSFACTSANK